MGQKQYKNLPHLRRGFTIIAQSEDVFPSLQLRRLCTQSITQGHQTTVNTMFASLSKASASARLSEGGARLAQTMQVGPCIPVGIQLYKAEVGPTSGPTWRLSCYTRTTLSWSWIVTFGDHSPEQRPVDRPCAGRKPPFSAVKRPARPYKSPIQNRCT